MDEQLNQDNDLKLIAHQIEHLEQQFGLDALLTVFAVWMAGHFYANKRSINQMKEYFSFIRGLYCKLRNDEEER